MSGTRPSDKETPDPPRPRRWPRRAAHVITGLSLFGGASLLWLTAGISFVYGPADGTAYPWGNWWLAAAAAAAVIPLLAAPPVLIVGIIVGRWIWVRWGLFNLAIVLASVVTAFAVLDAERRAWERQRIEAQPLPPGWLNAPPPSGVPEDTQ